MYNGGPIYTIGERVIFTHPCAQLDGRRGEVIGAKAGGYYEVRFDDGETWEGVWESKLDREADNVDYPLPRKEEGNNCGK